MALSLLAGVGVTRLAAQDGATITGVVRNEAGQPLSAVTVFLTALSLGTQTREDGRYTLVVPVARATGQTSTLTARIIGYRPQSTEITISGTVTRDFTLPLNPLQLGEVVITGAGTTIEAEKLGSVRNSVSPALIQRSAEPNLVQALAAKAPNVQVIQSAGDPGASSYIRIRGLRTVNSSGQPLFIVDGVPIDNSTFSTTVFNPTDEGGDGAISGTTQSNRAIDLNSADIENVEILKGPAAGAIYGARAAQGVILITTKKGRAGQTRYSLSTRMSWDDITKKYPLQKRFGQGTLGLAPDGDDCAQDGNTGRCLRSWGPELTEASYKTGLRSASCNAACADALYAARFPNGIQIYDHATEGQRTGLTLDNNLSVSGGNERTTFFFSAGRLGQKGIWQGPNNQFDRSTVRLNASHRMLENLNVLANVSYADTRGEFIQRGNNANGLQLGLLRTPPEFNNAPYLDPATGQHRSYRFQQPDATTTTSSRGFDNPLFILNDPVNRARTSRTQGNIGVEYSALEWLRVNYTLGADYWNDERLEGAGQQSSDVSAGGRVTEGNVVNFQLDHNLTATGTHSFSPNFSGTLTLGQNLDIKENRQISVVGRTLIAPRPYLLRNTVQRDQPIDAITNIRLESYFGQATIDLFEQLFVTAALRNDGSSTFSKQNARSWFPKVSVAWNATQYLGQQKWLSFAKLRSAYGEAGQEPNAYLTSLTYDGSTILSGIVQGTGFTPTYNGIGGLYTALRKAADDLREERTKELEVGFDVGLFKDVSDLSFTYYDARTEDVILDIPLSPSTGFFRQAQNAASLRNHGIELSLNIRPLRSTNVNWDIGLNFGKNISETTDLLEGLDFTTVDNRSNPVNVLIKGQPVGVFHHQGMARCGISAGGVGSVVAGVDLDVVCADAPRGALYLAADGFPRLDPNRRVLGDPNPDWTGGLNSSFTYKQFTVSGLLDIRKGGDVANTTQGALYSYGTHKDTEQRATCPTLTTCTGNEKSFGAKGWYSGPVIGPGVDASTGTGRLVPIGQNWFTGIGSCNFGTNYENCIEDGGFVKLREIAVAYSLGNAFVRDRLGLSTVDLRLAGRNLATWTDYTGYDPETNLGGAIQNTRGQDYFNNPQTRSFVLSLTLNR
jgi:TonB-linked SusC/RagA family outer membrane protein